MSDVDDLLPCRWPPREGLVTVCTTDHHHEDCPARYRTQVQMALNAARVAGSEARTNPPFDPDDDLMADVEGSKSAVSAYKREAAALRRIDAAIERSSLGTPEAKTARAATSDEEVARVIERYRDLENGCTCTPHGWWRLQSRDCSYHLGKMSKERRA